MQAVTPITQANGVQVIFAPADWRHFAGCADWCDVRHYQLLQPCRGTADRDSDRRRHYLFPVALCLVIGANLGSGLLAMLNNSAANAAARRVALGSLLFKLVVA